MARIVIISDTHGQHERLWLPEGDVLVHCGDFCIYGRTHEAAAFAGWMAEQPHPHKIVIAGNHDRCLEEVPGLADQLFSEVHYLFEREVTVAGLRFWGAPWQPWFLDWAFNLPRGPALRDKWSLIPEGVDVLVTHGPPRGCLDRTVSDEHAGCEELRAALDRVAPKLHIFGHIHEAAGAQAVGDMLLANAAVCDLRYRVARRPVVVELTRGGTAQLVSDGQPRAPS